MAIKKTIVLKSTMECNLRCKYCYEFRQNGENYSQITMDSNKIKIIINSFAELFPKSQILWLLHGGEPLLNGINYFEEFLDAIRKANENYDVDFKFAIQTNATLLNEQWINIIKNNMDILSDRMISISIDGNKDINNIARVNKNNSSSYEKVVQAIEKLKSSNIDFSTISVIARHNVNKAQEVYDFLKKINPSLARLIPCYNYDDNGELEMLGITPLEYSKFMCKIFDIWINDDSFKDEKRFIIDPIMTIVSKLTDVPVNWCEYRNGKCDNFISIYPDGEMWLCDDYDHSHHKNEAFLGNIFPLNNQVLTNAVNQPSKVCDYDNFYRNMILECKKCDIYQYCCGGCIGRRAEIKNKSIKNFKEYCEAKKILIKYIKNGVDNALS